MCAMSRTLCALSRSLRSVSRALGYDTAQPTQPYRDTKRLSRDTKRPTLSLQRKLCHNKLKFHTKVLLSRHKKSCRNTKVPVSQKPVATYGEPTLSRQRILYHDREPKEVCRDSPPLARKSTQVLCRACKRTFRVRRTPPSPLPPLPYHDTTVVS